MTDLACRSGVVACEFLRPRSHGDRTTFSEAGSIGASTRTGWFGYCMSKAALNMAVKNLGNDLAGQGFTFRLYHPGWLRTYLRGTKNTEAHMEPEEAAAIAVRYFLEPRDAEVLELVDWKGSNLPW